MFISNYAFSELSRQVQDMYLERVILKSKSGYIMWNGHGWGVDGYTAEEILRMIPDSRVVLPAEPFPVPKEFAIIVWGTK